jgi:TonB family protein
MKKIKIMKQQPPPSDEEIRSYMNFDNLLEKRKFVSQANRATQLVKWGVPTLVIVGLIGWYILSKNMDQPQSVNQKFPLADSSNLSHDMTITREDSLSMSKETVKSKSEIKGPVKGSHGFSKKSVPQHDSKALLPKEDVYIQAEPVDGYARLYEYLNENLIYPQEALKDSIQGVQTVSFVINIQGKPESISISSPLGEPFEKEAKRLVENMPLWKPASINGKPISSKVSVPLTFQIQKIRK